MEICPQAKIVQIKLIIKTVTLNMRNQEEDIIRNELNRDPET